MMSELKPCPFCGGLAEMWRAHENPKRSAWIACVNKCLVLTKQHDTNEAAITAWNTRTPDPRVMKLVEAAREFMNSVGKVVREAELYPLVPYFEDLRAALSAFNGDTNEQG